MSKAIRKPSGSTKDRCSNDIMFIAIELEISEDAYTEV